VKFIKKFEKDYDAKLFFMVENYRSSHPIIKASSSLISFNKIRMKKDRPLCLNKKRRVMDLSADKIAKKNLVQLVNASDVESQACFVAQKIKQIMQKLPQAKLDDFAIISRHGISFPFLVAVRMALAQLGIPFCYSIKSSSGFPVFKIREIQKFLLFLDENRKISMTPIDLKQKFLNSLNHKNVWTDYITDILEAWCHINSDMEISISRAKDFAIETLMEEKKEHKTGKGVFLGTIHSVKGMEFSHVFILDGGWHHRDMEEERRLYYVGMTRAKESLYLCSLQSFDNPHISCLTGNGYVNKTIIRDQRLDGFNKNITISIIGMKDLYISYAGRFPENHMIHQYLCDLQTGEKVKLENKNNRIFIVNGKNKIIAALSQKGCEKWQYKIKGIISAKILGIIKREPDNPDQKEFDKNLKTSSWELPIIEVLHKRSNT
jgi:ATP-dependent DNA helicase RecQ